MPRSRRLRFALLFGVRPVLALPVLLTLGGAFLTAGCGTPRPTAGPGAAPSGGAQAADLSTLSGFIGAARARYNASWYRTLSFVQTTTFTNADGTTREETWREVGSMPGVLRIDLPEHGAGNVYLFRGDSTYVFRGGEQAAVVPEGNPLMLLGFDLYFLPVAETVAGIAALGVDTTLIREAEWEGRPAWVVGGAEGDETSPQVWFDRERLVFLRLIERAGQDNNRVQDIRFQHYEPLGGGWIAPRVELYVDGRLAMTEVYADVRANPSVPAATFSPTPAGVAVRWWE
ncbi:MAG TPA: hypothetical protein VK610_04655 [Rhodothermales bacterium]|nr:hypothetical protein [Rhodothermales bacterium]